jgi:hypothetical protein
MLALTLLMTKALDRTLEFGTQRSLERDLSRLLISWSARRFAFCSRNRVLTARGRRGTPRRRLG